MTALWTLLGGAWGALAFFGLTTCGCGEHGLYAAAKDARDLSRDWSRAP